MPDQIGGRRRRAMTREVVGRAGHDHLEHRRDRHGHHVLGQTLAESDACVVTVGDDIRQPVVHHELHAQQRIARHEFAQMRFEQLARGHARRVDAQQPGRRVADLVQVADRRFDRAECGAQRVVQPLAVFGQRHVARGAVQQLHVQLPLERFQVLRQRGARHAHFRGGLGEAQMVRDAHEPREGRSWDGSMMRLSSVTDEYS